MTSDEFRGLIAKARQSVAQDPKVAGSYEEPYIADQFDAVVERLNHRDVATIVADLRETVTPLASEPSSQTIENAYGAEHVHWQAACVLVARAILQLL